MSLINQMLRDLEQRKPAAGPSSQPLSIQLPQQPIGSRSKWVWLAVAALTITYIFYQDRIESPGPAVATQQPIIASPVPAKHQPIDTQPPAPQSQAAAVATEAEMPIAPAEADGSEPSPAAAIPIASVSEKAAAPAKPKPMPTPVANPKQSASSAAETDTASLFRQAQDSASLLMRKETLKDLLTLDPRHLPARNLMLQTLIKLNEAAELDAFAQESLDLFPSHLAFITARAHLQIQRKQFAAALAMLEQLDASQINDQTYLSLLAAVYQQQQHYQKSADLYQRLTQLQPDKAEHWLGLGIASENLHHSQSAISAYRQALAKNSLNRQVVDYINQRLGTLTR